LALTAAVTSAALASSAAAAAGPVNRPFAGGEINQLAINDGPTQGFFANVSYRFEQCGTATGETACSWQVDVGLAPEGFELCPSTLEAAKTIWSSGKQAANGSVQSGPETFALRGTPGQVLCVVLSQTSSGKIGGEEFKQSSATILESIVMDQDLVTPIEAVELRIIRANPPAQIPPPPTPTPFFLSPDCRSLTIGTTRYAFVYRQMGCRKAGTLARAAYSQAIAPSGYNCKARPAGGKRCWRQGRPQRYLEWHLPRISAQTGGARRN
jgi:hypothetical protein